MFYIVWSDNEYFEDIMDNEHNFKFGYNSEDAVNSYLDDSGEGELYIHIIEDKKAKGLIDKIKSIGFFTKEMEDEVFKNSEHFYVVMEDRVLRKLI